MRSFNFARLGLTIYYSADELQEFLNTSYAQEVYASQTRAAAERILRQELEDQLLDVVPGILGLTDQVREYIDLYGRKKRRLGIAVLYAHGDEREGEWWYQDGRRLFRLASWIARHDGRYACLAIVSCNPEGLDLKARRSLLWLPDRIVSWVRCEYGECSYSLIHPIKGEIDSNVLDYELRELKRELGQI